MINGRPWAVTLPTGGTEQGDTNNDWSRIAELLGKQEDRFHCEGMFSWCQDTPKEHPESKTYRGFSSPNHWNHFPPTRHNAMSGFRPKLIPLNLETLQPDPSYLSSFKDGSTFLMGTLYMDQVPLHSPHNPVWLGDIPSYIPGASIRIGDSDKDPNNQISWIKSGDCLIADRNILKDIAWTDIERNGMTWGEQDHTYTIAANMSGRLEGLRSTLQMSAETDSPLPSETTSELLKLLDSLRSQQKPTNHEEIQNSTAAVFEQTIQTHTANESNPSEELVIQLAHLAGNLEAEGHLEPIEWPQLQNHIHTILHAYERDSSESRNPFALEDAAERYFILQFGKEEYHETAVAEGWSHMTVSELIADAKSFLRGRGEGEKGSLKEKDYSEESDKVIFASTDNGELWFQDSTGCEEFRSESGHSDSPVSTRKVIGIHTSPEHIASIHPAEYSALWEDGIPPGYQDSPNDSLIRSLHFGKLYDVCYYYTKPDDPTLYQGVDMKMTKGDILVKVCSNHYIEGAAIYEHQNILTEEEYLAGMRYNTKDSRNRMSEAQLHEVAKGTKAGLDEKALLRPELTPEKLSQLRTELYRDLLHSQLPDKHFEATNYGAVELLPGFKSEYNYTNHPDRICYVPELWDFDLGSGVTGNDILNLCNGDALKAQAVFHRCDWQHPSTILAEWDHEDDLALESIRSEQTQPKRRPLTDQLNAAKDRAEHQTAQHREFHHQHSMGPKSK